MAATAHIRTAPEVGKIAPEAPRRLDGDRLCLVAAPCLRVWMAGNSVEFRCRDGSLLDEGVLQVPARRP